LHVHSNAIASLLARWLALGAYGRLSPSARVKFDCMPSGVRAQPCYQPRFWHLKVLMDAIFGPVNVRNEITWRRTPFSGSNKARARTPAPRRSPCAAGRARACGSRLPPSERPSASAATHVWVRFWASTPINTSCSLEEFFLVGVGHHLKFGSPEAGEERDPRGSSTMSWRLAQASDLPDRGPSVAASGSGVRLPDCPGEDGCGWPRAFLTTS